MSTTPPTLRYLAVCPAGQATYIAAWISQYISSPSVSLRDITANYSVLALMGPKSRDVLQKVTKTPLDNDNFPFSTLQVRVYMYVCMYVCMYASVCMHV